MKTLARSAVVNIVLTSSILAASAAQGASVQVDANARPWDWSDSLNPTYRYGVGIPLPPTVVTALEAMFSPGVVLRITASGSVSAGEGFALVDPDGQLVVPGTSTVYAGPIDGATGDSGGYFPSLYTPSDWNTDLMALMGTFADDSGAIVGTPFEIGKARDVVVPVGATRLQLGINDDVFGDNTGSFAVSVSAVPEPASVWLMLGGIGVLGTATRRRRLGGRAETAAPAA